MATPKQGIHINGTMIDKHLYSVDKLDARIKSKLQDDINDLDEYLFEGDDYNKINFVRLLVFYDNGLFEKAVLNIEPVDRWINAYYWYSVYIYELEKQHISVENHMQLRFKLIEQIDYTAGLNFDWNIIERIEKEFK